MHTMNHDNQFQGIRTLEKGIQYHTAGQLSEAILAYRASIALYPDFAETHNRLGMALSTQNKKEEAIIEFRKAIELNSRYIEAYYNLGNALLTLGQIEEAIKEYKTAIDINPNFEQAHNNMGSAYSRIGKNTEAIDCFRNAVIANPNFYDAYNNLGLALQEEKIFGEAMMMFDKALAINPKFAKAHFSFGALAQYLMAEATAVEHYQQAVEIEPDFIDAHNNLGTVLLALGRYDEAEKHFAKVLELNPNFAEAYSNLGYSMAFRNKPYDAIKYYNKALSISPDDAVTHWNLAYSLLYTGQMHQGWKEYEWRRIMKPDEFRAFAEPEWRGEPLSSKTIFIYSEQGHGDAIQALRYISTVQERNPECQIILELHLDLTGVARDSFPKIEVIGMWRGRAKDTMPKFDVQCSLASLPYILDIPAPEEFAPAYLVASQPLVDKWRDLLKKYTGFKVGLAWAGNPNQANDRNRSIHDVSVLKPLFDIPGVTWFSLQVGKRSDDLKEHIIDLSPQLTSYQETAAVMENLDLIISVDTSVLHLAGATGNQAWAMLAFAPDWRWMQAYPDSTPWYSSIRLFRQPEHNDWRSVVEKVESELRKYVSRKNIQ